MLMDRQEVWEHVVGALEREFTSGEFGEGEFSVFHNQPMASISIVETRTSEGFVLLNVTGAAFSDGVDGNGNDVLVAKVPIPPV
jgi:hypothetical protein